MGRGAGKGGRDGAQWVEKHQRLGFISGDNVAETFSLEVRSVR